MKQKILVLISLLMGSVLSVNAQEVQLATLQQGEDLQVFYGADAFKNALDVASDGDLITLTAGTFNAANITKAVKIQGAGYIIDTENGLLPSVINGSFTIQLPNGSEGLLIEGIYMKNYDQIVVADTIALFTLRKSRLCRIYFNGHSKNCLIDQCRISDFLNPDSESENLYVKNSIIKTIPNNSSAATLFVENCIVITLYGIFKGGGTTAFFRNNIIGDVEDGSIYTYGSLVSSCSAYNNVFIRGNANDAVNKSDNKASDANTLFGYTIAYDDNKTYELTPEAAAAFLGTDGTQVGIYGGDTPFASVPTNPQITQKNIATKSTPDGKLNVSIKVEAQNQ